MNLGDSMECWFKNQTNRVYKKTNKTIPLRVGNSRGTWNSEQNPGLESPVIFSLHTSQLIILFCVLSVNGRFTKGGRNSGANNTRRNNKQKRSKRQKTQKAA